MLPKQGFLTLGAYLGFRVSVSSLNLKANHVHMHFFAEETWPIDFTLYKFFFYFILFKKFFSLFWAYHVACGILVPQPGMDSHPLRLKYGVLTTRLPVKSLRMFLSPLSHCQLLPKPQPNKKLKNCVSKLQAISHPSSHSLSLITNLIELCHPLI